MSRDDNELPAELREYAAHLRNGERALVAALGLLGRDELVLDVRALEEWLAVHASAIGAPPGEALDRLLGALLPDSEVEVVRVLRRRRRKEASDVA